MRVSGVLKWGPGGVANLQLRPEAQPVPVVPAVPIIVQQQPGLQVLQAPSADEVVTMIGVKGWNVHPSRRPLVKSDVQISISNIQRQLSLVVGGQGGWSDVAWQKFKEWLQTQRRKRARRGDEVVVLALPAPPLPPPAENVVPLLALPAPPLPPPEEQPPQDDDADSDSDSSSSSDSSNDSEASPDECVVSPVPEEEEEVGEEEDADYLIVVTELKKEKEELLTQIGEIEDAMANTEACAIETQEDNDKLMTENRVLKAQNADQKAEIESLRRQVHNYALNEETSNDGMGGSEEE